MAIYKICNKNIFFIDVKNKRGKFTCEEFIDEDYVVTGQMVGKEPFGDVYLMQMQNKCMAYIVCIKIYDKLKDKGYDITKYTRKYL